MDTSNTVANVIASISCFLSAIAIILTFIGIRSATESSRREQKIGLFDRRMALKNEFIRVINEFERFDMMSEGEIEKAKDVFQAVPLLFDSCITSLVNGVMDDIKLHCDTFDEANRSRVAIRSDEENRRESEELNAIRERVLSKLKPGKAMFDAQIKV